VSFSHGAKDRLTRHDLGRFAGDSLFDRVARAVCEAEVLPRKELYEAWEVARRTRRRARGGRVVDVAGGHGLLAHVMLLLDDTSPEAVVVDPACPPSADVISAVLTAAWPRLAGRVRYETRPLGEIALTADDVVVSSHACGALSDAVLDARGYRVWTQTIPGVITPKNRLLIGVLRGRAEATASSDESEAE
jgi:hypothetical protein